MSFDWTAPDGKILPAEKWLPAGPARAIIIGIHGLGGAADYFASLGESLKGSGFATFALNLRGQGWDPEVAHRGAFLDLPAVGRDMVAFSEAARAQFPGIPLFFCGESMGSLILAWMAGEGLIAKADGLIFSVPVVALIKPTPWLVRQIVHGFARFAPGVRFSAAWFVSGETEPLAITRDEVYGAYAQTGPHHIPNFTFRTLAALGRLIDSSMILARKITAPSLVLAAGRDVFVRVNQIQSWYERLAAADKKFAVYPEAYHLLWNDADRAAVIADIEAWLNAHLPAIPQI